MAIKRINFRYIFSSAALSVLVLSLGVFFFNPPDRWGKTAGFSVQAAGSSSVSGEQGGIPGNVSGKFVFQYKGGIYTEKLGSSGGRRFIARGEKPRWSPDGTGIAYISGNRIMLISEKGGEPELLATASRVRALTFSPDGRSLFFTDRKFLQNVDIRSHKVKTVLKGYKLLEIDAAGDPLRIAATVKKRFGYKVYAFDLRKNDHRTVATGCSASLSPDGSRITVNGRNHRLLHLYDWKSLDKVGAVKAPVSQKFDNQTWSNSPHWLISVAEDGDLYIHQLPQNRAYRVTWTGGCDRPDLFMRNAG